MQRCSPFFKSCVFLALFLFLLQGCASAPPSSSVPSVQNKTEIHKITPQLNEEEQPDTACSYFYFLWGANAAYKGLYDEAFEAFEKASLCDPDAEYISEKIPLLLIEQNKIQEATDWLNTYLAAHPEKDEMRLILAQLKAAEGKNREALNLYEKLLKDKPDNVMIRLHIGLLYIKIGDLDKAQQTLEKIVSQNETSYLGHLYLARLYNLEGQTADALNAYSRAIELNWSKDLLIELAEFHISHSKYDSALAAYRQILQKDPSDEDASMGVAHCYLLEEKPDLALKELDSLRSSSQNPSKIDLIRAQIFIDSDKLKQAQQLLESILNTEEVDQANYLLALVHYKLSHFTKALTILKQIGSDSSEFRAKVLLQTEILEQTNQTPLATKQLENILAEPDNGDPVFYSLLASLYFHQNNSKQSLQSLNRGIELFPKNQHLLYERAILLEKEDQHEEAMRQMQALIKLNPNNADALNFVGYSWAEDNTNLQTAFTYLKKAADLKPDSGYIRDSLGWVYYRMGDYALAMVELKKAEQLIGDDPYVLEHLGDLHHALGNKKTAITYYQKAMQALGDSPHKNVIESKIQQIDTP